MLPPINPLLFATFTVICSLSVLKVQVLGVATAITRGKLKRFLNPEDAAWLGGECQNPDDERVQRIFRAHRNDLENLLPFFISGSLFLCSGGSLGFGLAYYGLYLFSRLFHSFAYLQQRARMRRDAYSVGWLVTIVMGLHAAWNAGSIVLR
jgi:uncharacterized MAPEG superfamily protein